MVNFEYFFMTRFVNRNFILYLEKAICAEFILFIFNSKKQILYKAHTKQVHFEDEFRTYLKQHYSVAVSVQASYYYTHFPHL